MNEEMLQRRLDRERKARKTAEGLLEKKSLELYTANQQLAANAEELGRRVVERSKQLDSSEYRKSAILKAALDAIVTLDEDNRILEFNPAATALFGYQPDEVIGQQMYELLMVESIQGGDSIALQSSNIDQNEIMGKHVEFVARNKSGEQIPIEAGITRIEIDDQIYYIAFLRDISRHKLSEKLIIDAKDAAESASKAKSDFLAVMSHEIRTPINAILGSITILREMANNNEEQLRFLKLAGDAGNSLLSLINDILDYSKIEAEKMELESIDFNLIQLVEDTLEILSTKALEKEIELAVCFASDLPAKIKSDPTKIRQILLNLLSNALKFTAEGGIVVAVDMDNGKVKFSVVDTGLGIPDDKVGKLFSQFSQADSSTQRKYGGSGLGLAISSKLATLLGGEIGVTSFADVGSQFWFTIEAEEADQATTQTATYKADSATIYESNIIRRCALIKQLESMGLDVQCEPSKDGENAEISFANQNETWQAAIASSKQKSVHRHSLQGTPVKYTDLQRVANDELPEQMIQSRQHDLEIKENSRYRLLLAEDAQANQIIATTFLNKAGYNVDIASNGKEAVEAMQAFNYDLVLMDISMPEMDGIEATLLIREQEPENKRAIILALTANVFKDDIDRCLHAGMDGFIPKPINKKHLLKTIADHLHAD